MAADRTDPGPGARTRSPWVLMGLIVVATLAVVAFFLGYAIDLF